MANEFVVRHGLISRGDIDLQDNNLTTSLTNQDITIVPTGTGNVILSGIEYPNADGTLGQVLRTSGSGVLSFGDLSENLVLYVDATNGDDTTGNGAFNRPYETIGAAISAAVSNQVIIVAPGTYSENLNINKTNISIIGNVTSIVDTVTIQGMVQLLSSCIRLVMQNIRIQSTGSNPCVLDNGSLGGHYFDRVTFDESNTSSDVGYNMASGTGIHMFIQCNMLQSKIIMNAAGSDSPTIIFQNGSCGEVFMESSDQTFHAVNVDDIGPFNHDGGNLYINNCRLIKGSGGFSIISTVNSGSGTLSVRNSICQTGQLINKTGSCSYLLQGVQRDITNDILNGTQLFSDHAHDIEVNYAQYNYVVDDSSLISHIEGIDEAIGDLDSTFTAINAEIDNINNDLYLKISSIIEDNMPILGGNLDVGGNLIVSSSNANIELAPDGTGFVVLDGLLYPQMDGVANSILKTDGSGVLSFGDISQANIIWVDPTGSDVTGDGSLNRPVQSITHALSLASPFSVISLTASAFTENITISIDNLTISGFRSGIDSACQIIGSITLSPGVMGFTLRDIKVSPTGSSECIIDNGSDGGHTFENVQYDILSTTSDVAYRMTNSSGLHRIVSCQTFGLSRIIMNGVGSTDPVLRILLCQDIDTIEMNDPGHNVQIENTRQAGPVIHSAGSLYINQCRRIKSSSGICINSTANGEDGFITIIDSNTRSNGIINKTGSCGYTLQGVDRDDVNDVLSGEQFFNDRGIDISAGFASPAAYTPMGLSVSDHLEAIDSELGILISSVIEDDMPVLGGNLDTNGYAIVSDSNQTILLSPGGEGVIEFDGIEFDKKQNATIIPDSSDAVFFTFDESLADVVFIDYILRRGTDTRFGTLIIGHDGNGLVDYNENISTDIGTPNIIFDAVHDGGSTIQVRYTSTAGAAGSMAFSVRKWQI